MRFLWVLIAVVSSLSASQTVRLPAQLDSLIQQGVDAVMLEHFESADSLFRYVSWKYDAHPVGPVMQAALIHLIAEDRLAPVDTRVIDSLHTEVEKRGEAFNLEDPDGRVALAFVSSSRGVVSLGASREGAWFKAISYALKAASLGEDILKQDSAVADAGLVVGNYYYWKSRRVEVLTWLPFVADSRDEGLSLLRHCAENGTYQRFAAMNSLGWILRDAGEGAEGIRWVERALSYYPTNRPLLRSYAALLQDAGRFASARDVWRSIHVSIERDGFARDWGAYEAVVMETSMNKRLDNYEAVQEGLGKISELEQYLDPAGSIGRREQLLRTAEEIRAAVSAIRKTEPSATK